MNNQNNSNSTIILNSIDKLEDFIEKIKFPNYVSVSDKTNLQRAMQHSVEQEKIDMEAAHLKHCTSFYKSIESALSSFTPVVTSDNDKQRRTKKISLRIISGENKSKCVIISLGLYEKLDCPEKISFYVKDNVLVVGERLPNAKQYVIEIGNNGLMLNSASLVDCLCKQFNLIDFTGNMNNKQKYFKTSFEDCYTLYFKGDKPLELRTAVFFYMPPSF